MKILGPIKSKDIRLVETCEACPEQYDAFFRDQLVGYLRLRHGYFYVSYPECGGKMIYEAYPEGDGRFENDERPIYLEAAKNAIINEYKRSNMKKQLDAL